ncbi:hypothetical protein HYPSUDRAFT_207152 [Hypholoma sublateritium FD-334 SS-4]|uniref:Uncharacterized protein n=1 Tax=Hypholoma sublateritium (strain FD-334 SS-4) TaxID=945553 RepID=A0A0D2LZF6_HYPSF|nr:hypothetical protein HYPSUDRAFT_207152 [Hypholoma sublateritium FD-334 SS-4]
MSAKTYQACVKPSHDHVVVREKHELVVNPDPVHEHGLTRRTQIASRHPARRSTAVLRPTTLRSARPGSPRLGGQSLAGRRVLPPSGTLNARAQRLRVRRRHPARLRILASHRATHHISILHPTERIHPQRSARRRQRLHPMTIRNGARPTRRNRDTMPPPRTPSTASARERFRSVSCAPHRPIKRAQCAVWAAHPRRTSSSRDHRSAVVVVLAGKVAEWEERAACALPCV